MKELDIARKEAADFKTAKEKAEADLKVGIVYFNCSDKKKNGP